MRMDQGTAVHASPPRRRIIRRPRLTTLLDASSARVTVLLAAAGYGKTTLAREWLEQPGRDSSWLRITTSASDVAALALSLTFVAGGVTGYSSPRLPQWLRSVDATAHETEALTTHVTDAFHQWPSPT